MSNECFTVFDLLCISVSSCPAQPVFCQVKCWKLWSSLSLACLSSVKSHFRPVSSLVCTSCVRACVREAHAHTTEGKLRKGSSVFG